MCAKLKKMLKNQKGMTLVELLAVIVILGIITAIAIPSVSGIINKSKNDADISNGLMIINVAKIAVADQDPLVANIKDTGKVIVNLTDLSGAGYLDDIPNDPHSKGVKYSGTRSNVTITTTNGKYSYAITLAPSKGNAYLTAMTENKLNGEK